MLINYYLFLLQQYRPVSADLTKLGLASMFTTNDNEKPNNAANNVLLITCECSCGFFFILCCCTQMSYSSRVSPECSTFFVQVGGALFVIMLLKSTPINEAFFV